MRYEETDQTGAVYHSNYFRYFEVGRVELLRVRGVAYRELEARGFRLPVVEARASYRAPARFDDALKVHCEVARLRPTRIDLRYTISPSTDPGRILAHGETVLACLGPDGRPCRLPDEVRAALGAEEVQG